MTLAFEGKRLIAADVLLAFSTSGSECGSPSALALVEQMRLGGVSLIVSGGEASP